ncbi:MAG: Asp-tRNA(Asn)/Glu-tRNA(Gln) amidotransferase subunit GatC [Burkholderiaceae bacterium]|nr:Asp-tRNA(Asn)/Glu-tRNA(Gln) amidotransferase subunit GatC [Burkholderiaceae bacterium]
MTNRHHRGFIQHNAFAPNENQGIGGSQVDRDVLGEVITKKANHEKPASKEQDNKANITFTRDTVDLNAQDLDKLARLARLAISEHDRKEVLPALISVVNWVGELSKAPTEGVAPMAHPHDLALRLRADEPAALPSRETLMQNAPQAAGGLFIVPRVVE